MSGKAKKDKANKDKKQKRRHEKAREKVRSLPWQTFIPWHDLNNLPQCSYGVWIPPPCEAFHMRSPF